MRPGLVPAGWGALGGCPLAGFGLGGETARPAAGALIGLTTSLALDHAEQWLVILDPGRSKRARWATFSPPRRWGTANEGGVGRSGQIGGGGKRGGAWCSLAGGARKWLPALP
jgi:hypothetical protein